MIDLHKGALELLHGYEGLGGQEGDLFFPYQGAADKPGVLTIGRGRVLLPDELASNVIVIDGEEHAIDDGLTLEAVDRLFVQDAQSRIVDLKKHIPISTPCEFGALFILFYNYPAAVISGTPGKAHRQGNKKLAAESMSWYTISAGKHRKGLHRRRMSVSWFYLTGEVRFAQTKKTQHELFDDLKAAGYSIKYRPEFD